MCPVPEVHGPLVAAILEPYLARKVWKGRRTGKWAPRAKTTSRTPAWRSCSATCPTSKRLGSCGRGTEPVRGGVRGFSFGEMQGRAH